MKILLLHNYFSFTGGEDVYHDSLKTLLTAKGNEIIEFTRDSKDIGESIFSRLLVSQRAFWNGNVYRRLSEIILKEKPKIAHFNNIFPLITPSAYHICNKLGIPIVQTVHDYRYICQGAQLFRNHRICDLCVHKHILPYPILYKCYHRSRSASLIFDTSFQFHRIIKSFDGINKFIFPSNFSRNYFLKHSDIPERKAIVVPYFTGADKNAGNHTVKKDYFLFVGRLSEEKGIKELLDVFSSLPKYKLVVIGDGPLRKQVDQYKKYKNIVIRGFLSRKVISNYMRDALAVVIPSLWFEVSPLVLIEAYANKTPVIVPEFGAFQEAVRERETGLFYRQYDFADLKSKIVFAYEHKSLMLKMGQNALGEYMTRYTPRKHYQMLMKVYRSLIGR